MRRGQDRVERLTNWGPGHQARRLGVDFPAKTGRCHAGRAGRQDGTEIRSTILFGIRAKLTRAPLSLAGWFLGLVFFNKKVFMSVGTKTWNHQDDTTRYDQPLFEIKLKLMGTPLAVLHTSYLSRAPRSAPV